MASYSLFPEDQILLDKLILQQLKTPNLNRISLICYLLTKNGI